MGKKIFMLIFDAAVLMLAGTFFVHMSYLLEDVSDSSTALYVMLLFSGGLLLVGLFIVNSIVFDDRSRGAK